MSILKTLVALTVIALLVGQAPSGGEGDNGPASEPSGVDDGPVPHIQIAILLDTSGSMSGLIEQAKTQLWKIVNEFVNVTRNGKRPVLQIALYQYGSGQIPAEDAWMRRVLPLTDDLDTVSQELFALTSNGSEEYCGQVIKRAVDELDWSASKDDYKVIFIAGNEPFTQGSVNYADACKAAIEKGIVVNTIHCGTEAEGINGKWNEGALLAEGSYMFIDHNRAVVVFKAPQDKELMRLGAELNTTYIAYGERGAAGIANQTLQDRNAAASPGSEAERAVTKASANYFNGAWDLVDAYNSKVVKLEELEQGDLPEAMRTMTLDEQRKHIETVTQQRVAIQKQINKLNEERKEFIAEERTKLAESGEADTLDEAMNSILREQAEARHFELK
ncbi:MAG: VWA domain-containing protein [Verrucomicrobia bacterium]|nr:VWA domain-containing protein [Verrucomicrobiota bacterium]